jgi:Fe-S-cluster containining protein
MMACEKLLNKCKAQCCGVVPIPSKVWEANQDKINRKPQQVMFEMDAIIPVTKDGICPFLSDEHRCNIYDDRPEICQKFSDESHPMMCCTFINKDGVERKRQDKRRVERMQEKFVIAFQKRL